MKWLLRAAAALILVIVPTPALAAGIDPALEPPWPTLLCTSGAIDETAAANPTGNRLWYVELAGHLDCARPVDVDAYYGFATYGSRPLGLLKTSHMVEYDTAAPSLFSHRLHFYFVDVTAIDVCLVTEHFIRVGCVTVRYDGQAVTVQPLPTGAPSVTRHVRVERDTGDPDPNCGGCW